MFVFWHVHIYNIHVVNVINLNHDRKRKYKRKGIKLLYQNYTVDMQVDTSMNNINGPPLLHTTTIVLSELSPECRYGFRDI